MAGLLAAFTLATPAAFAGSPGHWDVVVEGSGAPAVSQELGVARAGGALHVAWRHDTSPLDSEVRVRSISAAGRLGAVATAVSGWSLGADPTLLASGGGLRVFFAAGTPIEGLLSATAPAAGAPWTAPALVVNAEFVRARTVGATSAADGTPIQTWYSAGDIVVHRGLSEGEVFAFGQGGTNARPDIVTEAGTGAVLVAWCNFASGVLVRRVDPATGAPAGAPVQLPGSTTDFQGNPQSTCVLESEVSRREPLTSRPGGGVFVAGTRGYPALNEVLVWRLDGSGRVLSTIVVAAGKNAQHGEPAITAAPDGRIWVAWLQTGASGKRIVARRSNRAGTSFGAPVTTTPPGGISTGTVNLSAQTDRLDVLAIVAGVSTKRLTHTQLLPGLTLARGAAVRKGKRYAVTFNVLDAGDPVAGARVSSGGRSATTGATGRATLVLPRGAARVTAAKSGYVGAVLRFRCC
jgi:hypothetical protein